MAARPLLGARSVEVPHRGSRTRLWGLAGGRTGLGPAQRGAGFDWRGQGLRSGYLRDERRTCPVGELGEAIKG